MKRYLQIDDIVIGKGHEYVFSSLSGIGGGNVRRSEREYINDDGAEFDNIYYNPRSFEVTGYVLAPSLKGLDERKQKLIHACTPKKEKEIVFFDGVRKYKATAISDNLPEFGERKFTAYWNLPFVLNITIPTFYWTDYEITNIPVILRKDEIQTSFTLPCVFTSRVAEAVVDNSSGFDFYPVVKISAGNQYESGAVKILNETTGEYIQLSGATLSPGDIIVIDCENLTAVLNGKTNIINSFNDFESFKIIPGKNVVKGINNNSSSAVNITMEYYKKWIGV